MNYNHWKAEQFAHDIVNNAMIYGDSSNLYFYPYTYPHCMRGLLLALASEYVIVKQVKTIPLSWEGTTSISYKLYPSLKGLWIKNTISEDIISGKIAKCIYKFRGIPLKPKKFGIHFPWHKTS